VPYRGEDKTQRHAEGGRRDLIIFNFGQAGGLAKNSRQRSVYTLSVITALIVVLWDWQSLVLPSELENVIQHCADSFHRVPSDNPSPWLSRRANVTRCSRLAALFTYPEQIEKQSVRARRRAGQGQTKAAQLLVLRRQKTIPIEKEAKEVNVRALKAIVR
jgi:hypothetical protein